MAEIIEQTVVKPKNKTTKTKEIATIKNESVDSFISQAITSKAPIETLERLFVLQKEVKAEIAKEAFVSALAKFQGECPVIEKTKNVMNKDGRTIRYKYAPMDSVAEQIKKPLSDNGFSYNWDVERIENHMRVICKLTHLLGHRETSIFEIPIVENQYMTSPQSYATAQSYAKRYTLLNVLGIGTAEEDTDSTDTGADKSAKSLKARIIFLLRQLGKEPVDKSKSGYDKAVKELTKVELKEENYEKVINALELLVQSGNEENLDFENPTGKAQ